MNDHKIEILVAAISAWNSAAILSKERNGPVRTLMSPSEPLMMRKAIELTKIALDEMQHHLNETLAIAENEKASPATAT
jgi:hypothetical protein